MKRVFCLLLVAVMLLAACQSDKNNDDALSTTISTEPATAPITLPDAVPELSQNVTISCEEGTAGCYRFDGETILFAGIREDSLYSISGEWSGNIVIDIDSDYQFELEMKGFSIAAKSQNPIFIRSADKVTLTAKKDYENYIYDQREEVDPEEEGTYAAAVYAECDLTIGGKGSLMILSSHNNGIHTKDDLEVKNLNLSVICVDNSLKGNDSVSIEDGCVTLIARQGDGIKTSNSNVSDKGNQRGTVWLSGCVLSIYAACDGIDAAYDVIIEDAATELNIYTDRYSEYSETVDKVGGENEQNYISYTSKNFTYSVKYYNSDTDYTWVDAQEHSTVSGGRSTYYVYSYPSLPGYSKVQFFGYASGQPQSQDQDYAFCTDYLSINTAYDTFALGVRGNSLVYSWTDYDSLKSGGMGGHGGFDGPGGMGGHGGMGDGNTDKGTYSTKGIKAANSIQIFDGSVYIRSYDDAIHAGQETTLENGATPTGNVAISGGSITVHSNDDGLHAEGVANITNGIINVVTAYEGIEGNCVQISGGQVSVTTRDDGINATATSGAAITICGGSLYVSAGGDGLDSNSTSAYDGIRFSGGTTVVISASNGNSAIDSERGYSYSGGYVLAITSSGGMSGETTNCQNLASLGKKQTMTLRSGEYVVVKSGTKTLATVKLPCNVNALVVFLGNKDVTLSEVDSVSSVPDANGVYWNVS